MNLEEENEKLKEENKKLKKELEKTKKEFEDTKKDFENTKKEFEEFKSKYALAVSNLKKALKIKADSHKAPKPLGAPKGHKGYARHIPERIDPIKDLIPKRCPYCNTKLGKT